VIAGVAGLYLSYYARTAGGASIAGMMVALYVVVLTATALRPRIVSHRV
jgi:ABC-type Mn2+/Zn2+ transport system permease subunit